MDEKQPLFWDAGLGDSKAEQAIAALIDEQVRAAILAQFAELSVYTNFDQRSGDITIDVVFGDDPRTLQADGTATDVLNASFKLKDALLETAADNEALWDWRNRFADALQTIADAIRPPKKAGEP